MQLPNACIRILFWILSLFLVLPGCITYAASETISSGITIVYPDMSEPYRSIFAKIIEGIEDKARAQVRRYPIGASADAADINGLLKRGGTKVVIALGRQGLKVASGLDRDIAVVVGGVLSIPDSEGRTMIGISLTPDPALLFSHLKKLRPGVKRVFVVYDSKHNDWLIKLAREAAKAQGLDLVAKEASNLGAAAHLYEDIFASADSQYDAVWLPQDATTVEENTILPLILKESWSRGVPVFSSTFPHVKKGILFALYPDNVEMGRTLASYALGILASGPKRSGIVPLRDVSTAVNVRTASHIGLALDAQRLHDFDFVFPEP